MTDVTPGVGFVGIQPCRVADTRGNGAPIQGGIFANSAQRTWDLTGLCGLPAGTDAISANFTVVAATGIPAGSFLLAWPTGQAPPPTAIMTYGPGQIISNAAIVPLGPGEQMNVNVSGSTHIVMDVNGYFTDQYNPGVSFHAVSSTVPAIQGDNTGTGYGVLGTSVSGYGVVATTGGATPNAAVYGSNTSTADSSSGVYGQHVAPQLAYGYGVYGFTSGATGSAGVLGVGAGGRAGNPASGYPAVPGVRGEARDGFGVLGLTVKTGNIAYGQGGVRGMVFDLSANQLASGYLGYAFGTTHLGLVSDGSAQVGGNLVVTGNFSSANKFFIEPHPSDPSKEIRYVSLEGPHAEVYFRGTAQISRGVTRIEIPEDFRYVADPQTYSAMVTPLGGMATVAVLSQGSAGIVVQASRDVKVNYVVYAERAAVKNPNPIAENEHFRPMGTLDVFGSMPDSYKRLLVLNGTLNPDGTVNRETARRLGWELSDKAEELISRTPN